MEIGITIIIVAIFLAFILAFSYKVDTTPPKHKYWKHD